MSRAKPQGRPAFFRLIPAGAMIAAALILFGCASAPAPPRAVTETAAPVAFTPPVEPRTKGSLWSPNRQLRLYEDLRARQVGDIVTVSVVENSDAKNEAETSSDRDTSLDAKVTSVLGYQVPTNDQSFVGTTLANKFKGKGSTDRKSEMTTSIACRVVQVMPSGNLHIKGSRLTMVNAEKLFITLEGVIRPSDISPDNVVLSTHVAEARISYTGSGPVSDQQRPGWFTRLMNAIWPF